MGRQNEFLLRSAVPIAPVSAQIDPSILPPVGERGRAAGYSAMVLALSTLVAKLATLVFLGKKNKNRGGAGVSLWLPWVSFWPSFGFLFGLLLLAFLPLAFLLASKFRLVFFLWPPFWKPQEAWCPKKGNTNMAPSPLPKLLPRSKSFGRSPVGENWSCEAGPKPRVESYPNGCRSRTPPAKSLSFTFWGV